MKMVLRALGTSSATGSGIADRMEYQLTQRIRVAVSESQGVAYVVDFKNDRVLVVALASMSVQCVLTAGSMRRPYSICMDDGGLLYVGSWETGQVLDSELSIPLSRLGVGLAQHRCKHFAMGRGWGSRNFYKERWARKVNKFSWQRQRHITLIYSATSRIPQLQRRCSCHRQSGRTAYRTAVG